MPTLIHNFRYRPEIDGLRAVAVLAVVLYHAGIGLPGGFIGVDVFFVVSGFLITSLIIKDLQEDRFSFLGFWERRARRIIPAMAVVVTLTLVAGWFLLLPRDYAKLGKTASYQSIFAANIYFYGAIGYFTGPAEENALLHTWSLAVEEQFYLFVPLILFGLFKFAMLQKRARLQLIFFFGLIASLGASVYVMTKNPSAAFYLLPTRAWELLCGCFVAVSPIGSLKHFNSLREFFGWGGLFLILLPCWLYSKDTPFPGLAAVPPCLGTTLLIWATGEIDNANAPKLILTRVLSTRPVVFLGLISYSLYLWHWPLFAFSAYWSLQPMSVDFRMGMVALAFFLAFLSWRFVETPFRKRHFCSTRAAMLSFGVSCIVAIFTLGAIFWFRQGFPSHLPPGTMIAERASNDKGYLYDITASEVKAGRLVPIGNLDPAAPVNVLVWGDSHAMAAMPAFDEFLKGKGIAGRQATTSATAPVIKGFWRTGFTNSKDVKAFNEAVIDYIKIKHIPNVVLVAHWEYYTDDRGDVPLDSALLTTIERLVEVGSRPWVFLQIPQQRFNVPRALALEAIFHRDLVHLLTKPEDFNGLRGKNRLILDKVEAAGGYILDPRPSFLDNTGSYFIIEKDGIPLYRDAQHLTAEGAKMMLIPFLRESFNLPSNKPISSG